MVLNLRKIKCIIFKTNTTRIEVNNVFISFRNELFNQINYIQILRVFEEEIFLIFLLPSKIKFPNHFIDWAVIWWKFITLEENVFS